MKKQAAPIIAAILLLLPVLYVGSYFALAMPPVNQDRANSRANNRMGNYGWNGRAWPRSSFAAGFYWPLEQIDKKLRPRFWKYGGKDWHAAE